jgi:hypothetical protein
MALIILLWNCLKKERNSNYKFNQIFNNLMTFKTDCLTTSNESLPVLISLKFTKNLYDGDNRRNYIFT